MVLVTFSMEMWQQAAFVNSGDLIYTPTINVEASMITFNVQTILF